MKTLFPTELRGKALRWVVCLTLYDAPRPLSVAELVARLEDAGYKVMARRPGKAISDALRWEIGRGRVVQVRRGVYASGRMPRSTEWSMRERVTSLRATALQRSTGSEQSGGGARATGPVPAIDLDAWMLRAAAEEAAMRTPNLPINVDDFE